MKKNLPNQHSLIPNRLLTTECLAVALAMRPQSIRKRLSQTGAYFGLHPFKLPSGRLLWPADSVERLTAGAGKG